MGLAHSEQGDKIERRGQNLSAQLKEFRKMAD